jgi:hypothetical protein
MVQSDRQLPRFVRLGLGLGLGLGSVYRLRGESERGPARWPGGHGSEFGGTR